MISAGIVAYNLHLYELWRFDTPPQTYLPNQMDMYRMWNDTTDLALLHTNDSISYEMREVDDFVHMKSKA